MNRIAIVLTIILSLMASPSAAETRNFTLANFNAVRVEGDLAVRIETGKAQSIRAQGAQELIGRLGLRVDGRTLIVKMRKASGADIKRKDETGQITPLTIHITAREITNINLTGAGKIVADTLTGRTTQISLYGIGAIKVSDVDTEEMQINFNGLGGQMQIFGKAENIKAIVRGKGILDAGALQSEMLEIIGEGPVESQFSASKNARIIVSQFAQVEVSGDARCEVRTRNSAQVMCGGKKID